MKKHTPGPWEIKIHNKGSYFTEVEIWHQNYGRLAIMQDNTSIWNSEKKEDVAREALDQTIANANLMVAAPELLEALLMLMDVYESKGQLLSFNVDIARQAIKKATP
ncbi:hypothetical protein LCGC14_2639830 [marine sediment metagenome]|uniref:Uncharacterized protein n=1 Tax=marine sediment metagenome TaxID=412755 RepID=A0A0F8ZXR1_9ZZZZ